MIWEDDQVQAEERAAALVAASDKRSAAKRLGAWLDGPGRALRPHVVALARSRDVALPEPIESLAGKRLLRLARGLEAASRVRLNPIRRDEAFDCAHCGAAVTAHGRTARDHCPYCLHSVHVDVVPGDREADCGGILVPESATVRRGGEEIMIGFRCRRCGAVRRNRAALDGDPPDDLLKIATLPPPRMPVRP